MSSLLERLKAGTNNVKAASWPGTDEPIGIRILTEQQVQDAQFAVEELFKKHKLELTASTADAYQAELNTQVLWRAIVDPESKMPLFKSADELRGLISHPDVKAALIEIYDDWQADCSPALADLSEEQYEKLFSEVKKNGASSLNGSGSRTLIGLITYLADRQTKLAKVSGSTS